MDFEAFKQAVIRCCARMGIEEYELYYSCSESTSIGAFQHEINQFTGSVEGGVCFRCIAGGRMGYASTEDLDPGKVEQLVQRAADNGANLESEDPEFLGEGGQCYQPLDLKLYELPSTQDLMDTVLDTQELLYAADSAVIDGSSTQGVSERNEIAIYNSKGLDLHYENRISALICAAVVSDGTQMSNDVAIKLGKLDTIDRKEMTEKAVSAALEKMGGGEVATGVYPVIFNSKAMADLLSTFSGIFSSEAARKGLSRLAGAEGTAIASPVVSIVDDPFHPENPMPIHFDAEGSPTYCKKVVENGVLNTLLYNLKTAHIAGKKTTGNAAKGGFNAPVNVRPFTMYLAPGEYTEEQLLALAGDGVYINSLEGLHAGANPVSGDFSLQSAGYLIENGEKTAHIKGFTVAGNFYDLLKKITALSDQVQLPRALGKTAFGAPSVLVDGLSVAGK
jgi:PmbA protein